MCKKHTFPDYARLHPGYDTTVFSWRGCVMTGNTGDQPMLRQRFLTAVRTGQLGVRCDLGVVVRLEEFRDFFSDVNDNYLTSFLPAAALEPGRSQITHTKFVRRLRKGVYLVHSDVFEL